MPQTDAAPRDILFTRLVWLPTQLTPLSVFLLLIIFIASRVVFTRQRKEAARIPGPRSIPFIGNLSAFMTSGSRDQFSQISKKYGSIARLRIFSMDVIILSSVDPAHEILQLRSNKNSDRPRDFVMAGDMIGWKQAVTLHPAGPKHRDFRKLLNTVLGRSAIQSYVPLQEAAARTLARSLLSNTSNIQSQIRKAITDLLKSVVYGDHAYEGYVEDADHAQTIFGRTALPLSYAVDTLPWLKYLPSWLPGLGFKRNANMWRTELEGVTWRPFYAVKEAFNSAHEPTNYVEKCFSLGAGDEVIAWSALSLYTGGTDTTMAALSGLILALSLYPEVQNEAQNELDRVVGLRAPQASDRENLPYVNACILELYRWQSVIPLGIAHRATEDDVYKSYRIPAGATIISNAWSMGHDERLHAQPWCFNPSRYLNGVENEASARAVFGWGRRVCPGMALADTSLFLYASTILWALRLSPANNSRCPSNEEDLLCLFEDGVISYPRPYMSKAEARSPKHLDILVSSLGPPMDLLL